MFTQKGNYIYLPVDRIDECRFKDLGKHVSAYVKMDSQEDIVAAILVKNFNTYAFVVSLSKKGMIKKTSLPKYDVSRSSKSLGAMKLREGDEVVSVKVCYQDDDLIVVTKNGFYNRYSEAILQDLAVRAQGVSAISVKDDEAVAVVPFRKDGNELYLCSQKGSMKRIHIDAIPLTNRAVKGGRLYKQTKTNPNYLIKADSVSAYLSYYIDDGELKIMDVKDVPFMDIDATFSSPIDVKAPFSLLKSDMSDIITAEIVDFPEDYQKEESSILQTNLFDE